MTPPHVSAPPPTWSRVLLGLGLVAAGLIGLDVVDSDRTVVVVAGWSWCVLLVGAGLALTARVLRRPWS